MRCFVDIAISVQSIWSLYSCVIFLMIMGGVHGNEVFDSCDWKKSGLIHSMESREVEKVQLSCESGSIEWMYPTTALHIQFQYPYSTADFTACFLPDKTFSGASLVHQGERPTYHGGFGQPTGLNVIYADPDLRAEMGDQSGSDINEIACVNSTDGKLRMLLMGTFPRSDISRKIAAFKYELFPITHQKQRQGKGHYKKLFKERRMIFAGNMEDCRPCTSEELLEMYCKADFVARGHVLTAADDENYKWTNVEFLTDHVIRETPSDSPLFKPLADVPRFNLSRVPRSAGDAPLSQKRVRQLRRGFFQVPAQCGFRAPQKSLQATSPRSKTKDRGFVLMGNYNFNSGWLECFPRWSDMTALVERGSDSNWSPRRVGEMEDCDFGALMRTSNGDAL